MDSEDGQIFVKNLAVFVRTHERALANALSSQSQRSKNSSQYNATGTSNQGSPGGSLARSYLSFSSIQTIQPAKLTLTPHHLFYLLSKFEDLGVDVGPMNVRLENLQHDFGHSNYVSFMGKAPKSKGKQADTESLRSVSSIRSVVSNMSTLWSSLTHSHTTAKAEKRQAQFREDIRYLYSCFTKIPALKLSPDHRARLVSGYEEFPFDSAVPLFAFKNVSALEVCDLDFRQFHGWDRLAEQLRSLTVRRANVDDPIDLLYYIILDDMEKRRRRSYKTPVPTTPSTPGAPWPNASPKGRHIEFGRTVSAPGPAYADQRRLSLYGSPYGGSLARGESSDGKGSAIPSQRSNSPPRPISSRQGSLSKPVRTGSLTNRRSSASSGSSAHDATPRHSSTDLVLLNALPTSKWRFLRHLSLAENGLTYLSTVSLAPVAGTLQSLDLSGNLFSEVPDALASLTYLRALNLSNCMIDSLKSLARSPLPAITVLNLRSNRLLSLAGIERLFPLERIDLRDNKLHDPTELSRLTSMPDIVDLFVVKNPFTRTHGNYRVTIFNLFRSTPGRRQDVTIDTLAPTSNEKRVLVDWAPEPVNVPVIRPPLEDEGEACHKPAELLVGGAATEDELQQLVDAPGQPHRRSHSHRRSTSDSGPDITRKKKRPPRRRIVELSQAEIASTPPSPQPALPRLSGTRPRTPSESDHQPVTPVDTPYQTASTAQAVVLPARPSLGAPFNSPTPTHTPQIRDASDNDEDDFPPADPSSHSADIVVPHSDLYRQKIAVLKQDLGPKWLAGLTRPDEDTTAQEQSQVFNSASRGSTARPEGTASGGGKVVGSGRTLG